MVQTIKKLTILEKKKTKRSERRKRKRKRKRKRRRRRRRRKKRKKNIKEEGEQSLREWEKLTMKKLTWRH